MEFAYDGGGLAKGGTVTLYVDGKKAGEGRVDQTEPIVFSADETCDVGNEFGSPVTYDYPARWCEVQRRSELGRDRPPAKMPWFSIISSHPSNACTSRWRFSERIRDR
jgi:hypothetical protein